MQEAIAIILAYLAGSISFSYLLAKWLKGIDIRQHGSGNAGATNTLRILGTKAAVSVLLLDTAKGVAAVWFGKWLGGGELWVAVVCGLAAIIGHNWPVFFGFKGGKGIATTIGVVATLAFLPALFAGIIAIAAIAVTRYVSLGSLLFTGFLPLFLWWMSRPSELIWAALLIFAFAVVRHRSNVVKLLKGTENKLGQKK